ncbi:DUF6314 family protein [Antarcticimicrobium luteum]|uniref:Trigger factor n=1 Tax=Antarcticimicrobium luteum TaxID=2547397 RepID=A0A4R5VG04_9RHOB|nr:DUF6314 family protein [Antarcticimicrobium luteum]TDK51278.1 trigger factor [Antarcticimicrobium luteum]
MTRATRQLRDFLGLWSLDRRIEEAGGRTGRFLGQARWTPAGEGALYVESGQLTLGGHPPMQAERRYRWGADLTVWFEDGRFFHAVPPGGGDSAHWCAPDQYEARYEFDDWPEFRVTWTVRGPRKGYRLTGHYRPLPDAG